MDVAARRALLTGIGQVAAKATEQQMDDLDTDYVEVSYHSTARPSHRVWQGKIYYWDGGGKDAKRSQKTVDNGGESGKIEANPNALHIPMDFFSRKSSDLSTVLLPKNEYAHVMGEIAANITKEERKSKSFTKNIGDYIYTIESGVEFGDWRIVGKEKIK